MESLKNFNSICRTCMDVIKDKKFHILTIPLLVDKFQYITSLSVELSDILPKNICQKCFNNINAAYTFKIMCVESSSKLHNQLISTNELKSEEFISLEELDINDDDDIERLEYEEANVFEKIANVLNEEIKPNIDEDVDGGGNNSSELKEYSLHDHSNEIKSKLNDESIESKNVYNCDKCTKRFFKKSCFIAHQREHRGLKPFACPHCEKAFAKSSGLGVHIRNIHEKSENVFACNHQGCDKFYKRKQTLQWHCRTVHERREAETKLYICEDCGSSFKNIASLKKHRFKHTGEALPFQCTECGKRYLTKHKLKEHLLRHAGIKNFVCPYCGMRKTTRTELKTHINYHTKEKQYPCKYCDSTFNSSGNLGRHVRIVHEGIKDFVCKHCGRTFGKAETCRHHEMTHTGEKPYICYICGKRFIQSIALRVHIKRHTSRQSPKKIILDYENGDANVDSPNMDANNTIQQI